MKKILVVLIGCCLTAGPILAQKQYPTGLRFDDNEYDQVPLKAILTKGSFDNLAKTISFETYCPPVMSQGEFGTCVGFASTYYLRTMLDNIRQKQKLAATFSPSYTYNKIKQAYDTDCQQGATIPDALFSLKMNGAPFYEAFPYPACGTISAGLDQLAGKHKIGDVIRLFGLGATPAQKILLMKKALSEGYPVVIGMETPLSFFAAREVWEPAPGDENTKGNGHAMCVIGYDDSKFGGAFRIINSWGDQWADKGFCWVRYHDLGKYTKYAFQAFPDMTVPVENENPALMTVLKGQLDLKLRDGVLMSARRTLQKGFTVTDDQPNDLMIYRLANNYPSGTAFKLFVKTSEQSYLYVIGTDTTFQMNKLFPYAEGISPLLGPNETVAYPSETKSITMDDVKGTDYLIVLFSKKPLDYNQLITQFENTQGNLADRVLKTLKDEVVPSHQIKYRSDVPGFELDGKAKGSVVPLIVAIEHK
ncbi:MAG: DUF4384 domain-containing protein [Siphonobacter sp.]